MTSLTQNRAFSRIAPIAVASALFMDFIDSTALSTALPTLSRAFHSDPIHLKLSLTSYILTLAVVTPASGWVAERFGAKRVFMSAMVVFMLASSLCALAHSLTQLVMARVLQGIGGAMMTPVGRLIVVGTAPKERLVSVMASFAIPALIGPMIGPPLAGFVLSVADWPWIFLINLPVGALGLIAVFFFAPDLPPREAGPFDFKGFFLAATAIIALEFVAETAGIGLAPPLAVIGLLAFGLLVLWAFAHHALKVDNPILTIRLLAIPTFRASVMGGFVMRMSIGAVPFLLPLLLQVGMGWSPARAGLVSMGQALGALAAKYVSTQMVRTLGFRNLLVGCAILSAGATALPAFFRIGTPDLLIFTLLTVSGFIRSNFFTGVNVVAYADVEGREVQRANTFSSVLQQLSIGLGVSFGALMLHVARGSGTALTADRFTLPFLAIAGLSLLAVPVYARLSHTAGDSISKDAI